MDDLKFATGTWIYGTVGDRYLLSGYRQGIDIVERVKLISEIEGIGGIEMIYPADFYVGVDSIGEILALSGLDCCMVGVDLTGDPVWRYGSFSSRDVEVRRSAVETAKETLDAAATLGADRINVWPGEDGHDYPFQVDYRKSWEWFRESLAEVAGHRPDMKVCLEYKLREPRARSLIATVCKAAMMCQETGMDNAGVTIDIGHALQAGENIAESIAFLSRLGMLCHLHLNDNYRGWDDDMLLGSVHIVEFLEMALALRRIGYDGWYSVDVYPYREDPAAVVSESVRFTKGLFALLDRIGVEAFDSALAGDDPVPIISRIREALLPEA
jgi:xylose isomerase